MLELLLTGVVVGVLVYEVLAALLDPSGEVLPTIGF